MNKHTSAKKAINNPIFSSSNPNNKNSIATVPTKAVTIR